MSKLRVNEIFGPTIQGEGRHIGQPTIFVRMQGCDSKCSWCDTPYARGMQGGTLMTPLEIVDQVCHIARGCKSITFTGGNPFLQDLEDVILPLRYQGFAIAAETQGTVYAEWAYMLDTICVSPKLHEPVRHPVLSMFSGLNCAPEGYGRPPKVFFKFVIFEKQDLEKVFPFLGYPVPVYLQVGNNVGSDDNNSLLDRLRDLIEWVKEYPELLGRVEGILPQLHVLLYGNRRGV